MPFSQEILSASDLRSRSFKSKNSGLHKNCMPLTIAHDGFFFFTQIDQTCLTHPFNTVETFLPLRYLSTSGIFFLRLLVWSTLCL